MAPATRRLVQLTIEDDRITDDLLDKLLAKKRVAERKEWIETKGNLVAV
jgi:topoisomerase-4 subunit B